MITTYTGTLLSIISSSMYERAKTYHYHYKQMSSKKSSSYLQMIDQLDENRQKLLHISLIRFFDGLLMFVPLSFQHNENEPDIDFLCGNRDKAEQLLISSMEMAIQFS